MKKRDVSQFILPLLLFFQLSILSFAEAGNWNSRALQKIDHETEEFSFAVLGDNRNSVEIFEKIIQKINDDKTSFAISLGDTVQEGTRKRFQAFLGQLNKLKKPMLTVLGNHEIRKNGREVYTELFGEFYYSFTVGQSYFMVLDDANWVGPDTRQWNWLVEELQKSQDYEYRFVLMHIPLYDPRYGTNKVGHSLKNRIFVKKLNRLFDENNVTLAFASHVHGYFQGKWGDTPFVVTGGAGARLHGSDPRHYFYHYLKVKVTQDGVSHQVVKIK